VRESRETMFLQGRKLEDVQAGREERLPLVVPELEPFRELFKTTKWLGGESPNYADYRCLSVFLWTASVAKIPPLHDDDPLRDWIDRGFDLYGGLARHPGMHTLFGLPKHVAQAAE
jgi:glutathione S-transferase